MRALKSFFFFFSLFAGLSLITGCLPLLPITPTSIPPTPTATPLPTLTPTPEIALCTDNGGKLLSDSLEDARLPEPMRYSVYLPACYAFNSEQAYPVLYLFHGLTYDETQWVRLGVAEQADELQRASHIPSFIIVMPYNAGYAQPAQDAFDEVFLGQLIPLIDATYRTNALRAAGGLSRGGGWAIHFGSRYPELFQSVGAHSAAIFWAEARTLETFLSEIPEDTRPNFYVDISESDKDLASVKKFITLLGDLGYSHEWHLNIGLHNETYWNAHLKEYLLWYGRQFSLGADGQ